MSEKPSISESLKAKVQALGVGKSDGDDPPEVPDPVPETDPTEPPEPADPPPEEPVVPDPVPDTEPEETPDTDAALSVAPTSEAGAPPAPLDAPASDGDGLSAEEAGTWSGFRLDEVGGGAVGKVEGIYVDTQTGAPEWLHARMGRFGHHCLVPARDAVAGVGHVWVPYSRDLIRAAPRLAAGSTLDRDTEASLLQHYGVGTDLAGRGAEIAAREAGAATIKPAGS